MPSAVNAAAAVNGCEAREGSGALVGSSVMGRSSKENYARFGTTKNRLGAVSASEQNAVSAVDMAERTAKSVGCVRGGLSQEGECSASSARPFAQSVQSSRCAGTRPEI